MSVSLNQFGGKPEFRLAFLNHENFYNGAADAFMNDVYDGVVSGKLPKDMAEGQIKFHVFTLQEKGQSVYLICEDAREPNVAPLKHPLLQLALNMQAIKVVTDAKMTKNATPGYVDRSASLMEHFAAKGDHEKVAKLRDMGLHTPSDLRSLVGGNMLSFVEIELNKDPDLINARLNFGRTPIFYARTIEMFDLLMKYKPDLTIKDGFGDPSNYFYRSIKLDDFAPAEIGLAEHAAKVTGIKPALSDIEKLFGFDANRSPA